MSFILFLLSFGCWSRPAYPPEVSAATSVDKQYPTSTNCRWSVSDPSVICRWSVTISHRSIGCSGRLSITYRLIHGQYSTDTRPLCIPGRYIDRYIDRGVDRYIGGHPPWDTRSSESCQIEYILTWYVLKTLKGYCHDNFAAFSSKLWWNYDPEPLFKTRNTSATTRGQYREILQGRANQCFFSGYISHSKWKNLENVRLTFSSCSPHLTMSSLANDLTISNFSSLINHFYAKRDHCLQIITDQNISFAFSRFTKISWQCPFKFVQH